MCERKMTFWGICFALVACVGLTGAHAADTVIGQIEVKNGTAGTPGATGASAYQIWLANGNTGSEADFLASLVGATGPQGVAGKDGTSVKIKGTVSSCANLPNNADIGDIYMVTAQGNQGYIYDGTSWHCPEAGINIQGPQGPAGAACQSTLTTAACGPDLTQKCPVATKSGVIYTKTDCNNANPTQDVVYNGADGATGQDGTPGCATTLSKSKVGKVTTITAKDCNNTTLWTETVSDGNDGADGQDGAPGCADKVDISDKNAQGCYTITKTPYSLVSGTCTAGTPVNKLVCDGAAGTNGTNCEPTFSSAHDATNKKTVVTISGCGSTSTVDIPDGQDGNDGAPGTNGTNCEPTFSSAHDATNKKTVVTISGCGSTSTVDIPDGQDGQDGAPGTNGVGICDNVANPATAVKTYTKTYTAPTATKAGYVRLEQTMCNDTTNSTDYEDTCVPIVSSNKDICSGNGGMYMECVRQDTSAVYNICRPITTQNASAISTAIDAAQSAAETYADNVVANKVTSSDVNSAISTALSDYDTSTQVSNKITAATSNKVTTDSLNTTLSSYLQTANLGTALKDTALKDDVASAVSASGALSGYLTSADASSTYATQTALNTADGKITALESTVGDSNSGLVKQVATNTSTIGNASSGLVKDVADAKTSAANAVSTANTASNNATQAKQDAADALDGLNDKLDKTVASSTYLSQTDATSTYLKQTDASSTYLTKDSAQSTYATNSALTAVETTANNAATNATRALNKATTNETNIGSLNTTVSGHTTSITSLTSRASTLESTVNGTCSGSSTGRDSSESGAGSSESGGDSSECTQSLESRIRALEAAVFNN